MNRIYRTLWSVATQSWQAVPETAKSAGKKSKSSAGGIVASVALGFSLNGVAHAQSPPAINQLPTGGSVARGTATIQQTATAQAAAMTVNQSSQRAVINWNTFNLGSAASINFVQPNAQAVMLNRVNDSNPSQIFGRITANGQVFLTNANGVYFSPTSSVDVGALTATTHSITDDNFMSGRYVFDRNGATGKVVNEGNITAALGGYVALLAPEVQNAGVVVARAGMVALAAGEAITLSVDGAGSLAGITTTPSAIASLVENKLAVLAPDGQIILSAVALDKLQAGVVRNSGTLDANSLVNKGGKIVLEGDDIVMDRNSKIEAKGATGGGVVLVGGDWQGSGNVRQATKVTMEAGATIDASATDNGDGGKVVLWSDIYNANSVTQANGSIKAEAGPNGGNGGKVETSGHSLQLGEQATVNTQAAWQGSNGQWLLDPANIDINSAGTEAGSTFNSGSRTYAPNSGVAASIINPSTIQSALASGDVTITATNTGTSGGGTGNITVTSSLAWTSGNQLILIAGGTSGGISGAGNITTGTAASNLTFNQAGSSTYSGAIGGSGSVTKLGAGTLTLSGLNTFTGNVNINAGTLKLGNNAALGAGTIGRISVASGAALNLNGSSLDVGNAKPLTISGTGVSSAGALLNSASSISIYPGVLTLGADATISSGSTTSSGISLTNQGAITGGSHNLTLIGSGRGSIASIIGDDVGTLTFTGGAASSSWTLSGANAYTGITTVSGGTLIAGSSTAFSTKAITVNSGGALDLNGQTMSNSGGLTITGTGPSTYGALTNGSSTTATYPGLLTLGADASIGAYAGGLILTNTGTITGNYKLTLAYGAGVDSRIDSIVNTGTVDKQYPGTWTLNAANTYSGGTTISNGALKLGNAGALGTGAIAVTGGELDLNGLHVPGPLATGPSALSIAGSGYLNGGALTNSNAAEATFDSPVILTNTATITGNIHLTSSTAISGSYVLILGGAVGGRISSPIATISASNGSLSKTGVSTWTVDAATTYSGATTVIDGTLVAGVDNAFGAGPSNAGITISALSGITKSIPTLSLGSHSLTTTGQVVITFGGGAITSTTGVLISTYSSGSASQVLSNADGSMYPSIISAIVGGATGVKKAGGMGILIMTGANTYTGSTVITAGTLQLGDGGSTGSLNSASAISISNGSGYQGTLAYNLSTGASPGNSITNNGTISNLAYGSTLNLSATGISGGTYVASVNESLATPTVASIVVPSNLTATFNVITSGFQPLFSPQTVISWTGASTGTATLQLNGVGVTSGQNAVGGVLTKNTSNISIGPGAMWSFTNAGATRYFNSSSDATNTVLSGTSSIVVPTGVSVTESGALSGTVGLTIKGGGTLTLDGSNSNSGAITVSAGTLRAGSSTAYGTGAITISAGAALDLNGQTLSTAGGLTLNGTGINSGGALMNSGGAASYGGLLTLGSNSSIVGDSGTIALSNPGTVTVPTGTYDLTLGGAAGGSIASIIGTSIGKLTKQDAGTWTLNGVNTYSGATTVQAGVLKAGSAKPYGTGAITVASGAALDLNGQTLISTGALTLNGTGISNGGALMNSSATGATATYPGTVTLGSNSLISGGSGTLALTYTAGLTGGNFSLTLGGAAGGSLSGILSSTLYSLTKQDAGTWTLNAANTNYMGGIAINGGTLAAGVATNAFGASANPIWINGGTLALGTYAETVGTVTIGTNGGFITNTASSGILTGTSYSINNAGTATATISASLAGMGPLTKIGSGLATLSGANTFTGAITIGAGALRAANNTALGASSGVTVASSATLEIGGASNLAIGAIPLTVADGGTVHNVAGDNTYAGNMTLSGNATITIDTGTSLNFTATTPALVVATGKRLTLNTNGDLTLGQALTGASSTATYIKLGSGNLNLASSGNTLAAVTGVYAGLYDATGAYSSEYGSTPVYTVGFYSAATGGTLVSLASGDYSISSLAWTGTAPTATSNVSGTYSLTYASGVTISNTQYMLLGATAATSWRIAPKPVTVTLSSPSSTYTYNGVTTYADIATSLITSFSNTAMASGNSITTLSNGALSLGTGVAQAGSFTITPSIATMSGTANNYSFTFTPLIVNVDKAHLTVTADNVSRAYGDANPPFTTTISGFVNHETFSSAGISGSGSATASAPANTNAGTSITITAGAGNLAAANYDFPTLANGTLTITPRPVTLTGQMNYSGQPTLDTTQTGTMLSASNVVSGDSLSITGTATLASADAGTRAITAFNSLTLNNSNYTTIGASGSVSVIGTGSINVVPLTNNEVLALIGSQLAGLTASQMASFSNAQLTVFSWQQIASLSPSQFAALTPSQLASLSATQLQGLSAAQLSMLLPAQLSGLTASQLAGLSTSQLQGLTTAQVRALSVTQISQLTPEQIAYLVGNGAMSFTLQQLMALSPAQLAGLSAAQVGRFTAEQLSSLSYAQLQALSLDQLAAISPAALGALSAEQIMALSLTQVASLTPDQLRGLSPTQIASLSAAEIASFDELQLAAIGIFPKVDTPDTPVEAVAAAPTKPEETAKFEAPIPVMIEVAAPSAPAVEVATPAPAAAPAPVAVAAAAPAPAVASTAQATPVTAPVDTEVRAGVLPVTVLSSANARPTTTGVAFEQDDNGVSLHVTAAPPAPPVSAKLVFNDKLTTFMVAQDNGKMVEFQGGLVNKRLIIVAPSAAAKQIARTEMNMVLAAAITSLGAENRVVLANLSGVVIDLR